LISIKIGNKILESFIFFPLHNKINKLETFLSQLYPLLLLFRKEIKFKKIKKKGNQENKENKENKENTQIPSVTVLFFN